jgi:hypothetical protein
MDVRGPRARLDRSWRQIGTRNSSFVPHRLEAIQDRWDALREAKAAFARGDYEAAMKTGVVCLRKRLIGGRDGYEVAEYEINTALIECLNSVEKRAAIETGQEVDRSDINARFGLADQAAILNKAFTLEELEAIQARILAAQNGESKELPGPAGVPDVQPTATDPPETDVVEDGVGPSVPKAPRNWRD